MDFKSLGSGAVSGQEVGTRVAVDILWKSSWDICEMDGDGGICSKGCVLFDKVEESIWGRGCGEKGRRKEK